MKTIRYDPTEYPFASRLLNVLYLGQWASSLDERRNRTTTSYAELESAAAAAVGRKTVRLDVRSVGYVNEMSASKALGQTHRIRLKSPVSPAPPCVTLIRSWRLAGRKLPKKWAQAIKSKRRPLIRTLYASSEYRTFLSVYEAFVRDVIRPIVCKDKSGLVYQYPPTLRVQLPGKTPGIGLHCDGDYERHTSDEINFWMPLSDLVGGSNSLWIESAPGRGDFTDIRGGLGDCVTFHGYAQRHYTMANATNRTRVSIDFRATPTSAANVSELVRAGHCGRIGEYGCRFLAGDEGNDRTSRPVDVPVRRDAYARCGRRRDVVATNTREAAITTTASRNDPRSWLDTHGPMRRLHDTPTCVVVDKPFGVVLADGPQGNNRKPDYC